MQQSFAGLMHAPLSLLVYTAPLLSSSSFSSLKDMAWGMILDRNQELAQAAGKKERILAMYVHVWRYQSCVFACHLFLLSDLQYVALTCRAVPHRLVPRR